MALSSVKESSPSSFDPKPKHAGLAVLVDAQKLRAVPEDCAAVNLFGSMSATALRAVRCLAAKATAMARKRETL